MIGAMTDIFGSTTVNVRSRLCSNGISEWRNLPAPPRVSAARWLSSPTKLGGLARRGPDRGMGPTMNKSITRSRLRPEVEPLEHRELLSVAATVRSNHQYRGVRYHVEGVYATIVASRIVPASANANLPVRTDPAAGTFVEPTAVIRGVRRVTIGSQDYVGPFVALTAASDATISMGNGSNLADNVIITAMGAGKDVTIGDQVIVAVAVHRCICASSARTATATTEDRLVLHGKAPQFYLLRAA